ncbi:MAG: hypothetical protein ACAI43_18130, partial [Phycisphaerae bacterium]
LRGRAAGRLLAIEPADCLDRRVADVTLDLRDPNAAVRALEQAARVRVEVDVHARYALDWPMPRADPGPFAHEVVRLRDVSVRTLLRTVARHVGLADVVRCEPAAGDVVRLVVDRDSDASARVVRAYDLRDLAARHRAWREGFDAATGGPRGTDSTGRAVDKVPRAASNAVAEGRSFSTIGGGGSGPNSLEPTDPDAAAVLDVARGAARGVAVASDAPVGGRWFAPLTAADHRRVREMIEWMRSVELE